MNNLVRIDNLTKDTRLADHGELAANPWRRMKGLLGRSSLEPGQGLVIRPCQGVHTWFMAFPIDVLYVDAQGVVCRVVTAMPPNRLGPMVWQSRYVVELPAGTAQETGTEAGDRLAISYQPSVVSR